MEWGVLAKWIVLLTAALTALGAVFRLLHKFLPKDEKVKIKEWIENFWVSTASLGELEQFKLALSSRRTVMVSLRRPFLKGFIWSLFLMFLLTAGETLTSETKNIRDNIISTIDADFYLRQNIEFNVATQIPSVKKYFETTDRACVQVKGAEWRDTLSRYISSQKHWDEFLTRLGDRKPATLRFAAIVIAFVVIALLSIPLSIALRISFSFTLWLLSLITRSKLKLWTIVATNLITCLALPPFIYSVAYYATAPIFVWASKGGIDYGVWNHPSLIKLIITQSFIEINAQMIFQSFFFYITYYSVGLTPAGIFIGMYLSFIMAMFYAYRQLGEFFTALTKTISLDFSTDYASATVSWAIFFDVCYSIAYLLPCFALIAVQRHPRLRGMFLNMVQWIAEHPSGPLIGLSEAATSAVTYLSELFKGK